MTREDEDEAAEFDQPWYQALTDEQRAIRADQWGDARAVVETERKKALRVEWADPTARKYV